MPSNLLSTWLVAIRVIPTTILNKVGAVIISILQIGSLRPSERKSLPQVMQLVGVKVRIPVWATWPQSPCSQLFGARFPLCKLEDFLSSCGCWEN